MRHIILFLCVLALVAQERTGSLDYPTQLRRMPFVDARTYGVKCDGSTNDSTTLASAIAGLPSTGATLALPPGTCVLNTAVTFNKSNSALTGWGIGATTIKRGVGGLNELVTVSGTKNTISNFTIDGNSQTTSFAQLAITGADNTVMGIEVINSMHISISVSAARVRILNNRLEGLSSATNGLYGVWFDSTNVDGLLISGNTIINQRANGIFGSGKNVMIANNYLKGNHVQITPGGGQIAIKNLSTNYNVIISGNVIDTGGGTQTSGIELGLDLGDNGPSATVYGNTIRDQDWIGIIAQSGYDHRIFNNTIANSGTVAFPKPGIRANANIGQFMVSNNRVFDDQGTKTQTWGVEVMAGTSNNYIISYNDVRGNVNAAGISDGGSGTTKTIFGNITDTSATSTISTANRIPKVASAGLLTESGASIDGSNNISTPGTVTAGSAGGVSGCVDLSGATSGTASICAPAVAGTTTITTPVGEVGTLITSAKPYGLPIYIDTGNLATAVASTTYFSGLPAGAPITSAQSRRMYVTATGTITRVYGWVAVAGTLSSGEDSTFSIRVNDTTDCSISTTVETNAVVNLYSNPAMTCAVTAGDYIELKTVTGAFVTAPTNVTFHAAIYIT